LRRESGDVADETSQTKRARQKQRRAIKREAERRADARARRRRLSVLALAGVVVAGAVGAAVANAARQRAEVAAREQAVAARLDDLGCTDVEQMPVGSTAHFSGAELVANPPEVAYPDRPAAGGRMASGVAEPGVYDELVDERLLVHNLEHGFVTVYHAESAPKDDVEALRALADEQVDRFPKLVVAPWAGELPSDARFAILSWGKRQLCRDYDRDVVLSYVEQNHGGRSGAPESGMGATGGSDNPVRPDGEGPFVLPPLAGGDGTPANDGGEDPEGR